MEKTVTEKQIEDLGEILKRLVKIRAYALEKKVNPWVVREALVIVLALDTAAARDSGISYKELTEFDSQVIHFLSDYCKRFSIQIRNSDRKESRGKGR